MLHLNRTTVMKSSNKKARVLVIGTTGQVGKLILAALDQHPDEVDVRISSRRSAQVKEWREAGRDAVLLDLDEPRTFGAALAGVDRLILINGYTVAMLTQSKTLVDAARKAGVSHIVHLGIYGEWDTTDPHFAWHQMIEKYIEASGMAWTHLHPNMFMENLLTFFAPRNDTLTTFWGSQRTGWVAVGDLADVAARILQEGPDRHAGQDYWLSTDALSGPEIAALLAEVTGRPIRAELKAPEDFAQIMLHSGIEVESWYAQGAVEFVRQVFDGRMGYIGSVRNDVPHLTGREAVSFRQWAVDNRATLIEIAAA